MEEQQPQTAAPGVTGAESTPRITNAFPQETPENLGGVVSETPVSATATPEFTAPVANDLASVAPAGATAGENSLSNDSGVFDANEPAFTPAGGVANAGAPAIDYTAGGSKKKITLWIVVGIIAAVVLVLGYLFIWPLFQKEEVPIVTPPVTETPVVTETPIETEPYTSLFSLPAPVQVTRSLGGVANVESVRAALVAEAEQSIDGISEVVLMDGETILRGEGLLAFFAPDLASAVGPSLEKDSTLFFYKDENGVWPGHIFKLSGTLDEAGLTQLSALIEAAPVSAFFLVDPGTPAAFQDGVVMEMPDRYVAFETPGASFGYLISNNRLLVSTSFMGMQEALRLLDLPKN